MPWPAEKSINVSGTGDNVIIAGVAGQIIRVFQLFLVVSDTTNLTFKDGPSTAFDGALAMSPGGSVVLDDNDGTRQADRPWFTTSPGNAFIINQSGSASIGGRLYYTIGLPLSTPP